MGGSTDTPCIGDFDFRCLYLPFGTLFPDAICDGELCGFLGQGMAWVSRRGASCFESSRCMYGCVMISRRESFPFIIQ